MNRLPRILLFLVVPALILPLMLYLRGLPSRPRPTEPLAGVAAEDDPDAPQYITPEVVESMDLAATPTWQVMRMDRRRVRCRVVTVSAVSRVGDRGVFEARVKDGGDDLATVWLYPGAPVEDGMVVEGFARVIHHPAGPTCGAFDEFRVLDAARVGE